MAAEQKNIFFKPKDEWNQLADIDIKVVRIGFAEDFLKWQFEHGFSEEVFYRLYFAVHGSFRIIYPGGVCMIEPGNFYLIPCDMLMKYEGITPCTHYWIHFASNKLKTIPHFSEPVRLPLHKREPVEKKMRMILKRIRDCYDLRSAVFIRNSILELLVPFLEELSGKLPEKGMYEEYARILNYIDTNLHRNFPVSELNVFSKLGKDEFSADFRRVFGLPPKQYITMRRMNRAQYLLRETDLPIKEIASQCGYRDEFFFHRIFRKYTKSPPAYYRKHFVF